MKVLLVAVNAKYIHTSLSVRTLKAYAENDGVEFAEYTINERASDILRDIYLRKCDAVLFSCYIWNVEMCLEIADMLKKVSPGTAVIFGGPEVSFDDVEYMEKYPFIDAVMRGEGEETFKEWLRSGGRGVNSMTVRSADGIVRLPDRALIDDIKRYRSRIPRRILRKTKTSLYTTSQAGAVRLGAAIVCRPLRIACGFVIWTP